MSTSKITMGSSKSHCPIRLGPIQFLSACYLAAVFLVLRSEQLMILHGGMSVGDEKGDHPLNNPSFLAQSLTIDILSVASIQRMDLLKAQQRSFASHISIRNFINVTERDDADPDCHKDVTWEHVRKVSSFCRSGRKGLSHVFRTLRAGYAREQWLEKKASTLYHCRFTK